MTRATKKVVFFAENKHTRNYLNNKCNEYNEMLKKFNKSKKIIR